MGAIVLEAVLALEVWLRGGEIGLKSKLMVDDDNV